MIEQGTVEHFNFFKRASLRAFFYLNVVVMREHAPILAICLLFILVASGFLFQPIFGDEIPLIYNVIHFVQETSLIPVQFNYPTFYSYFLTLTFSLVALIKYVVTGVSAEEIGFLLLWPINGNATANFELVACRTISMPCALGVILSTYRLGNCWNRQVGLIAAGLLAFTSTFVNRATLALPDILLTLLAILVVKLCIDAYNQRTSNLRAGYVPPPSLRWAAILSGVAVATKYNGAFILLPIFAVWFLYHVDSSNWLTAVRRAFPGWVLLGGIALLAFILSCPGWLLVPNEFWAGFQYERRHMMEGQLNVDWGEFRYLWIPMRFFQVEGAIGILFVLGACWVLVRGNRRSRILLLPVFASLSVVGLWRYTSIHYLLWCFPVLAISSAMLLSVLGQRVKFASNIVPYAIALLCLTPSLKKIGQDSFKCLTRENNLIAAERWIENSIPSGQRLDTDWYGMPTLWDEQTKKEFLRRLELVPKASEGIKASVYRKPIYNGYLGFQWHPPDAEKLAATEPEWVVTNSTLEPSNPEPLRGYGSHELADLHQKLAAYYEFLDSSGRYELVREFSDGPGPTIKLYRLVRKET